MRRPTPATLLAALYLALPTPGFAEDSPRTLSDDGIRKEAPVAARPVRRHFNGYLTRFRSGARDKQRHYFPGTTHYSTIKLDRAAE